MAEYYNKETLLDFVNKYTPNFGGTTSLQCVERAIENAPTVDVVEVVRCKDCVNFKSTSNPKYCTKHIDDWGNGEIYTDEDDFCSYGERKKANEY